jgi:hypothetical protein
MWVFTRYGFVSIACARKPNGGVDEASVMVRARTREHLVNLKARFADTEFGRAEIRQSVGTDYKYRVIVPKSVWVGILAELAMEQTWSNFKNEAARLANGKKDAHQYVDALHEVWGIMCNLQTSEGR